MSGASESKSSLLMIIVGVILIGALIGIFYPKGFKKVTKIVPSIDQAGFVNGQNINPNDNRNNDAYYIKSDTDGNVCGIKVFSPLPYQKVSFPLEVSGYVNGCSWVPFEGQVGTIELRDANSAISQLIILPVDGDTYTLPAYFKVKINPQTNPTSNNGVIIFHNDDPSGNNPETFQLPITF